jgi:hypothetical protein
LKTEEELQKHVKGKLSRGYPAGELTNDLLNEGYTNDAIEKAMNAQVKSDAHSYYSPFTYLLGIFKIFWGMNMVTGANQNGNYLVLSGVLVIGLNVYFQLKKK